MHLGCTRCVELFCVRDVMNLTTHKVLQDANIKLSTVATDVFGVSGKAMIMCSLWRRMNHPLMRSNR